MKVRTISYTLLLIVSSATFATEIQYPFLALDVQDKAQLPKNFRSTQNGLPKEAHVSTIGLKELNMLGSGQFSPAMLKVALKTLPQNASVIDVDLRQESHGFINGEAVSIYDKHDWGNVGKNDKQIQAEEKQFISELNRKGNVTISEIIKKPATGKALISNLFAVKTAYPEATLAKKNHMGYERIYVTDHCKPEDEKVDQFVQFAKQVPANTWLYFHCRAGVGRTTTFMSMYDMMHNAKKVSYTDILKRQKLLGGKDFTKVSLSAGKRKFQSCYEKRLQFLEAFYRYARTNQDNFATSWTAWQHQHATQN